MEQNAIVPNSNLTLQPDEKVLSIIQAIHRYFKQCEKMKRFTEAQNCKEKLELLKSAELK